MRVADPPTVLLDIDGSAFSLLCLFGVSAAQAIPILQAVSVNSTTPTRVAGFGQFGLPKRIDQSGLSAGYVSGVTDFDTYIGSSPTHHGGLAANIWATPDGVTTATIDFGLGALFSLDAFALWNRLAGFDGQIGCFQLFADDNMDFSSAVALGSFSSTGSGSNTATGVEVFSFAATKASYVRLVITSPVSGGMLLSAGEVAFRGSAVPEPSTVALIGLAIVGVRFSRRTRPIGNSNRAGQ